MGELNEYLTIVKRMCRWGVSDKNVPAKIHQSNCAVEGLRLGR